MYTISNIEEVLYKSLRKEHPDWSSERIDREINSMADEFLSEKKTVEAGLIDNVFDKKKRQIKRLLKTLESVSPLHDFSGCYKDTFCDKTCGACPLAIAIKKLGKYDIDTLIQMEEALKVEDRTDSQQELISRLSEELE